MKNLFYIFTGMIFSWGLLLSGMTDPEKIKRFLEIGIANWSPALIFVLFSAALVYFLAFVFLRIRKKTIAGNAFAHPAPRPIDKKLVIGSLLFGAGWGLSGVCPGPALVHLAFADLGFLIFIGAMFLGFEIQRRVA